MIVRTICCITDTPDSPEPGSVVIVKDNQYEVYGVDNAGRKMGKSVIIKNKIKKNMDVSTSIFYKENYYAKVKKRLGEILVESGVITEEMLEKF